MAYSGLINSGWLERDAFAFFIFVVVVFACLLVCFVFETHTCKQDFVSDQIQAPFSVENIFWEWLTGNV